MYVLWERYRYTGNGDVPVILPLSPHPPTQTFCLFFSTFLCPPEFNPYGSHQ